MSEDITRPEIDHSNLVKKELKRGEPTVGEYPQQSWKERIGGFLNRKKIAAGAAAGATATALAATGAAGSIANTIDDTMDAVNRPIEAVMPGVSSEFTTPKEVFNGSIDVQIDGELNGRRQPNTEADIVNWKDIKLVTSNFDPEQNRNIEHLMDLSDAKGFSVDNPLIVLAHDPDGGAQKGRWLKLPAEGKDGNRFYVYVSISEQTFPYIELNGTDFVSIKSQEADGKTVYLPEDESKHLPNGQFNHIRPLTPQE